MKRIKFTYEYGTSYASFASAVNITGELHIQGSPVLDVQLNNVQLELYAGYWQTKSSKATLEITALNSTLSDP